MCYTPCSDPRPPARPLAEADLLFVKCKTKAFRRITYSQFLDAISAKKPKAAAHAMERVINDGARYYPEEL